MCTWCPVNCQRTFIDVEIPEASGRPWSKVPLAEGWTRVDLVDMNTSFPKSTGMGADGIHPNDAGYVWMAEQWKQAINAVGCN